MTAPRVTARRIRTLLAAAVVVIVVAAGGVLVGRLSAPSTPATGSAAAGFLRDMQVHHAQAVELSLIVRDRTDDPDVRLLAYDIATSQGQQSGQMYGLLEAWDLPQASRAPRMSWMGLPVIDGSGDDHEGMGEMTPGAQVSGAQVSGAQMPGMASDADLERLGTLDGTAAETLFLTLMIAHHRGGVEMAEGVLSRTDTPQVVAMARTIVASQTAEIELMQELLDARS